MTEEQKDIWTTRLQAIGNMSVATVLVVALSLNTYMETHSRMAIMDELNNAAQESIELSQERNRILDVWMKQQERLIQTIADSK